MRFKLSAEEVAHCDSVLRRLREANGIQVDLNGFARATLLESVEIILENARRREEELRNEYGRQLGQQQSAVGSGDDGAFLSPTDGVSAGTSETRTEPEGV